MLRNTTYKGMAAYGKSKSISRRERLRPHRGQPIVPKISYSTEPTPKEKWIFIPVPAIVDERLFDAVQEQLDENRRLKRQRTTGIRYMLQGLVVCSLCNHAYCGNSTKDHRYYSCVGTRPHGTRKKICNNAYMRADKLENIAWEEIKKLLNNPYYIEKEYNRRIKEIQSNSSNLECEKLNKEKLKIEKSMSRLIDSYAEGIIDKLDFEPRIKSYKKRLSIIGQQILQLTSNQSQQNDLRILMERLDKFSLTVRDKLEQKDCQNKREIFEALIKQIEIGKDSVNIVFRVSPFSTSNNIQLEDCRKSAHPGYHQSRTRYQ